MRRERTKPREGGGEGGVPTALGRINVFMVCRNLLYIRVVVGDGAGGGEGGGRGDK